MNVQIAKRRLLVFWTIFISDLALSFMGEMCGLQLGLFAPLVTDLFLF